MDVLDAIWKRRSIRKFRDIPIPKDCIIDILNAGRLAPNAGNLQNCQFIVVDDEHKKDALAEACWGQNWMKEAPVFIVTITDLDKITAQYGDRGKMYAMQNAAAAVENMLLMATAHDLGSCWVSALDEDRVKNILDVPESWQVHSVIPLGYPGEIVPSPPKIPLVDVARINQFGFYGTLNDREWVLKDYSESLRKSVVKKSKGVSRSIHELRKK